MSYTAQTNHNTVPAGIHKLVFNRIAFLSPTQNNADIISNYIVEICNEIEPCLQISWYNDAGERQKIRDKTRVADESKYDNEQKSLIADMIAVYLLRRIAGLNASGATIADTGLVTDSDKTFLSKAKAGSVEVEYDQFDGNKVSSMGLGASTLIEQYEQSAFKKGRNLGCLLDICQECLEKILKANHSGGLPFINVQVP